MAIDERLLDQAVELFPPPERPFERLTDRRDRKRRNRRIEAAILALLVAAISFGALARTFTKVAQVTPTNSGAWSRVPIDRSALSKVDLQAVASFGGGFVAVGDTSTGGSSPVWTSPDGITWSPIPASRAPDSDALWDVVPGGPGLIAVGVTRQDGPGAWTSADGMRWDAATVELPNSGGDADGMFHVRAVGNGFMATGRKGTDGYLWTSTDGRVWHAVADESAFGGPGDEMLYDVTAGGPGYVAVGFERSADGAADGVARVWTSSDGQTWRRVTGQDATFSSSGYTMMFRLIATDGGLVAIGQSDGSYQPSFSRVAVWTSPDGRTWTREPDARSLDGAAFDAVAPTAGGYTAVGYTDDGSRDRQGVVWTSADAVSWTRVGAGSTFGSIGGPGGRVYINGLTEGPSGSLAVGYDMYVRPDHTYGTVGAIWTTASIPSAKASPSLQSSAPATPASTSTETGSAVASGRVSLASGDRFDLDAKAIDSESSDLEWNGSSIRHFTYSYSFVQRANGPFDALTGGDLRELGWARNEPNQAPGLNPPTPGEVFAVWTNGGNYAKVRVLSVGADLELEFVTYAGTDPPCEVRDRGTAPRTDARGATIVASSDSLVLCGTFDMDLDTGAEGGPRPLAGIDLWWEQIDGFRASLNDGGDVGGGGATMVNLGTTDFDSLSLADLKSLDYSATSIRGARDATNELPVGDVFAVHTSDGNFAKVQVLTYGYDLEIRFVTYAP